MSDWPREMWLSYTTKAESKKVKEQALGKLVIKQNTSQAKERKRKGRQIISVSKIYEIM